MNAPRRPSTLLMFVLAMLGLAAIFVFALAQEQAVQRQMEFLPVALNASARANYSIDPPVKLPDVNLQEVISKISFE